MTVKQRVIPHDTAGGVMTAPRRVGFLAGITFAAMVLMPIPSAAAQAAGAAANLPPLITHYGAIAYSQDGSQGKARRHLSKLGAQQQAMQRCGDNCTVVSTFTRCGAVAHDGATYQGGVGLSRGMAEARAISRLGGGWIVDWACN